MIGFAVAAFFFGAIAGVLHLYMRFNHNSQGEMFDDAGHVDLVYSAFLFLLAFAPVFFLITVCGATILALVHIVRDRRY